MQYENVEIGHPYHKTSEILSDAKFMPRDARESGLSYTGPMQATINIEIFEHRNKHHDAVSVSSKNSGYTTVSGSLYTSLTHDRETVQTDSQSVSIETIMHNRKDMMNLSVNLGAMPIMVKSERCHLRGLSPVEVPNKHSGT
jgi:DNA-directed RNA polymerase beta subunit